jgi:hypothetical protein
MAFGDLVGTPVKASLASGETAITFTAPTLGNLLVVSVGRSATHTAGGAWSDPSGWNRIHDSGINVGNMAAAWWWKISDGTETSFTCTDTNEQGGLQVLFCQYAGPFAVSPFDVAAENAANLSSVVTSQSSGTTATTAQADALAVAMFAFDRSDTVDGTRVYSNSFTESAFNDTSAARSGSSQARKVLSATGTVECTFSCTDTGDEMYGSIAVFKKQVASGYTMTADQGSFTLTGNATGLTAQRKLTAEQGTFSLTGVSAGLLAARKLTAAQGAFTLTGIDASLIYSGSTYILTADAGTFALTGNTAVLTAQRKIAAGLGTFTFTGVAASLLASRRMSAELGAFTLTGQAAALLAARLMAAGVGAYTLTGYAAGLRYGRVMAAAQGAFVLTGNAAGMLVNRALAAGVGVFVLTGQDVTLTYSGGMVMLYFSNNVIAIPFRDKRIENVFRDKRIEIDYRDKRIES